MDVPPLFRCPISMELMVDPVTISTGVTYERKNIEQWLFTYKKLTCPATMQRLETFDLTPNHTLNRLIASWQNYDHETLLTPPRSPIRSSPDTTNSLALMLTEIELAPFKASSLKKLRSIVERSHEARVDLVRSKGIEVLTRIMSQVANPENSDFNAFRACEEALAVLHELPLSDESSVEIVSKPESVNPLMIMLQRGSSDARLHSISILRTISKSGNRDWCRLVCDDVLRSLLDLLSDEVPSRLSSSSLDVLIEIIAASKRNRLKAIESGAVCILIELLTESDNHRCEMILMLIKMLCECPEGRSAMTDHCLGVTVVSKKILRVSEMATKLAVKILWLVCNFLPTEKVIDDMMVSGSVRKLLGLLHIEGRSSTKEKAMKIIKMHGGSWRQYPCFPVELRDCLRLR